MFDNIIPYIQNISDAKPVKFSNFANVFLTNTYVSESINCAMSNRMTFLYSTIGNGETFDLRFMKPVFEAMGKQL